MKPRLVSLLRCPACRAGLRLEAPQRAEAADTGEVTAGRLHCTDCGTSYAVEEGVPRLLGPVATHDESERRWTASRFGYLWSRSRPAPTAAPAPSYHFEKIQAALSLGAPRGLVLDAGCGDGVDLANVARPGGAEVIGVELSDGGCAASFARTRALDNAHVVQGDLRALPFADDAFDLVYSYGVVHHLTVPEHALAEMVRVARPAATVAVYIYEDFATRSAVLRAGQRAVRALRRVTTALPPPLLFVSGRVASPFVWAAFTLPHLLLRDVPGLRAIAAGLPFRHARGPFSLAGDLYDRFSAPVELRFGRDATIRLLEDTGLAGVRVAYERGWIAGGTKPAR